MTTRLIGIFLLLSLISCISSPVPVDSGKSKSYFREGKKYFYVQETAGIVPGNNELRGVSGELSILGEMIAADQHKIYYKNNIQSVADRGSFVVAHPLYHDKNHVYSPGLFTLDIIPAADPVTFRYLDEKSAVGGIWAMDKHRYFLRNKPVRTDFATFNILNEFVSYDSLHVYLATVRGLEIMSIPDGKMQKITANFCRDMSYVYYYSMKTGFCKSPITPASRISVIRPEEISVDKRILNVLQ